jgi:hypothetical protein
MNAAQSRCCADTMPFSSVERSENRSAGVQRSTLRLVSERLVEDFLGGGMCLLLWGALWSLFVVAYCSPSADLDEYGENTALERVDRDQSVPETARYVTWEAPKP